MFEYEPCRGANALKQGLSKRIKKDKRKIHIMSNLKYSQV
jgi:hypothetical protein